MSLYKLLVILAAGICFYFAGHSPLLALCLVLVLFALVTDLGGAVLSFKSTPPAS